MIDEKKLIDDINSEKYVFNLYMPKSHTKTVLEVMKQYHETVIKVISDQPKIGEWIKCTKRLPTMEECWENDCRFIVTDGNRRYERIFDYMDKKFVYIGENLLSLKDCCVVAWQPFPESYKEV